MNPRVAALQDKEYFMAVVASPVANKVEGQTLPWRGFQSGLWQAEINVRDFIQENFRPYEGDESFLTPAASRTKHV